MRIVLTTSLVAVMGLVSAVDVSPSAQPNLYGRVLLAGPSGPAPLRDAKLTLVRPGTSNVRAATYTDSRGNFAFYNVPQETYELQVLFGGQVLKQRLPAGLNDRRRIQVSNIATRVPDIVVTP